MRNVLAQDAASVLEDVARERMLLAFDFDGTLAPLVDHPDVAAIPGSTRALLRLAALLYPCAVISGRARADLVARLEGIPLVAVVGNHGAEFGQGPLDRSLRHVVAGWRDAARRELRGLAGVEVEDKGLSLSIHYRRATSRADAERAVRAAAAALEGARILGGCDVVNVLPPGLEDKGRAVARVAARAGARRALYVGDDATDEDAFRCEAVAVAVRVAQASGSAAGYFVPGQTDVEVLLRLLAGARRRAEGFSDRTADLERMLAW